MEMNLKRIGWIMLTLLLTNALTLCYKVKLVEGSGAIYIRADGSIDPPTEAIFTADNATYTFTGDIYDSAIVVLRNNIIIDGDGHTLEGYGGVGYANGLGIYLKQAGGVTIRNLEIRDWHYCAIRLYASFWSVIENNLLTGNTRGIDFHGSSNENMIFENDITNNSYSIWITLGKDNVFYHNNIVGGTVLGVSEGNIWDDGYPSGGNYWSDYNGDDVFEGPNQDQPGSDGIGDTPYVIDEYNRDLYPLMCPYGSPSPINHTLTIYAGVNGTTSPAPGAYSYSRGQTVSVKAIPFVGYQLDHWELDGANVGETESMNVTMNDDHVLCAYFVRVYTLTIARTSGGMTSPTPGIYKYAVDILVRIIATPDNGYFLDCWEFDGVKKFVNPIDVVMDENHTLSAVFAPIEYVLEITTTVGGITNPVPGTYTYFFGAIVTVDALSDDGHFLDCWELDGVDIGIPDPVEVLMDTNHTLHAVFMPLSAGHDVAVKCVTSKSVIGQGCSSTIKVTVINVGTYTETFNITTFANTTIISTATDIALASGNSTIIDFVWNTASFDKGNYTLRAYLEPVPDETNPSDNNFTDGWVIVAMVGDITGSDGWPDGKCDMRDIGLVARYFGQTAPPAPANCDFTGPTTGVPDGKVDMRDIGLVARHFGETDP